MTFLAIKQHLINAVLSLKNAASKKISYSILLFPMQFSTLQTRFSLQFSVPTDVGRNFDQTGGAIWNVSLHQKIHSSLACLRWPGIGRNRGLYFAWPAGRCRHTGLWEKDLMEQVLSCGFQINDIPAWNHHNQCFIWFDSYQSNQSWRVTDPHKHWMFQLWRKFCNNAAIPGTSFSCSLSWNQQTVVRLYCSTMLLLHFRTTLIQQKNKF